MFFSGLTFHNVTLLLTVSNKPMANVERYNFAKAYQFQDAPLWCVEPKLNEEVHC